MKREMLDVYVSELPTEEPRGVLIPKERDDEVRSVGSDTVRREKYYIWRLLETALWSSLGITLDEAGLYKSDSGKWMSSVCEISLSHSGALLAVAVSSRPVGIDIEKIITPRAASFAERVLTDAEFVHYNVLCGYEKSLYLTECWTKKEAMFKLTGSDAFIPSAYESGGDEAVSRELEHCGERYILAVASSTLESLDYKQMI